jgi:uncharacterized protein (DUF952 family)
MSVLFHIATRADWERATRRGVYAPGSLSSDGFVHCSTAEQHAAVANALFSGRRDLVVLLIDTSLLTSEVRFEGADRQGRPYPHVFGPLNPEAVFEVAPYLPGGDGRFTPHEEASGFQTHGDATLQEVGKRASEAMASFPEPWWVAGGWALDLFLGHKTRPHADLEISILGSDQRALFQHFHGWDLRLAAPEHTLSPWDGDRIELPYHQVWARVGPRREIDVEGFAADPTMLGFLLEDERDGEWVYRRHPAIARPLDGFGTRTREGVPIVAPEVALLFKAKATRFKDDRDFDAALPSLDEDARSWLASALDEGHPNHPWRARLGASAS